MRNKNVILTLLVVFAMICAYNLFYTWKVFNIEGELDAMTAEERSEKFKEEGFAEEYKQARKNSMSLGLDLKGGMFVTMEVGVEDVIRGMADNTTDPTFNSAMAAALKKKQTSQESFVDLFVASLREVDPKAKLATWFTSKETGISFNSSDEEIIELLKKETESAIDRTFQIIRTRIDQFGVASPTIQLQAGTGRILLELPGVKDADRVRKLLKGTAQLEFWETIQIGDAAPFIEKINQKVKDMNGLGGGVADSSSTDSASIASAAGDSTSTGNAAIDKALGGKDSSLASADTAGMSDEQKAEKFMEENPLYRVLKLDQNIKANAPVFGFAIPEDTSTVNAYLNNPEVRAMLPDNYKFLWTAKPENGSQYLGLILIKNTSDGLAPLGGESIERARADFDENRNPSVSMTMNSEGARIWKQMTEANINKSIAIVLDNMVHSYPTVNNVIATGQSQITGNFTVEESEDLANLLKAGKLPAPARIEGEEIVGPTLGAENVEQGVLSFFLGFIAVVSFMFLYYRSSGLVANVALILNLFFLLGVSAAFNVVLTLPGMAAIVLTMGMAVDANVLIYERVREELGLGKSYKAAISAGFSNAFSSIMDSNITTFLTGVILFAFGTGPIKGFAVGLMIGIVTSLVAALIVTRLIIEFMMDRGFTNLQFGTIASSNFFKKIDIKMVARRKMFYLVSSVLTILSIVSIVTVGFKMGVDFQGGRQYIVAFNKAPDVEAIRQNLTTVMDIAPVIKTIGNSNQLMITTSYKVEDNNASEEVQDLLINTLAKDYGTTENDIIRSSVVGPTVANDIKESALSAVLFSLLVIFLYVLVRFRKWQYSLGALVSLFHDVVIMLGVFSFLGYLDIMPFSMEIDASFIAAVLTVIGYSVNDTVIVFDRVREDINEMKTKSITEIFNLAMNQTLSRTTITSLTTILTALIMLVFGGDVIRGFMFALLIGITFGTYSSVFIASSISFDFLKKEEDVTKIV
jgi:SecD/SecF fusion protein